MVLVLVLVVAVVMDVVDVVVRRRVRLASSDLFFPLGRRKFVNRFKEATVGSNRYLLLLLLFDLEDEDGWRHSNKSSSRPSSLGSSSSTQTHSWPSRQSHISSQHWMKSLGIKDKDGAFDGSRLSDGSAVGSTDGKSLRAALAGTQGFKAVTGEITYSRPGGVPMKGVSIIRVHDGKYKVEEVWFPKQ